MLRRQLDRGAEEDPQMNSSIDATTQYARDVIDGEIVAGKFVRLAAQRHLDDLRGGHARGLTWDVDLANKAIRFFPTCLTITEGEKEGQPFSLLAWHLFVVGSIYGWRDRNGLRRFRFIWLETGKGQAKSPLMAGIGLYEILGQKRQRAEVYCIGEDRNTANVMFRDAVAMCRAPIPGWGEDTLESTNKVNISGRGDNAWRISHPQSSSRFEPVANGDAISGPKPMAVFGDEIHEMKTNKGISIWRAAIAKRPGDPMMILGTNTPSVDQQVGTEYSQFFQKVLCKEFTDDSAFAYIARVDDDDDPMNDEACWIKALPALGVTFPLENVRKEVETSRLMLSTQLTTKRLYFGIPVGTAGFWISQAAWMKCLGEIDEEGMEGRRLHLALDLSQKNDLTAVSGCWEGECLAVKTWYFTRDYELDERETADHINYREIAAAKQLTITEGATIDYTFVAMRVKELCASHDVVQMVVDSAYIQDFIRACDDIAFPVWLYEGPDEPEGTGLKIVRHAQGGKVVFEDKMLCMPVSVRHLKDHILKGDVLIEDNRLTTICASNSVLDSDAQKNEWFNKRRSRGRIDGMVTITMAVGSATGEMESESGGISIPDDYEVY
jgi:phage terminase large subunit-like protein